MEQAQLGKDEVISIMRDVGNACSRHVSVYMVGGGAMALRGEKDATKDVDLILESLDEAEELGRAFERFGFRVDLRHPDECRAMVDAEILSKPSGIRADIFVGKVCDKLRFTEGMKRRAVLVERFGNMDLYICSREDIFLLKSVTARTRDLDDMMSLFRRGLSRDVLLDECESQGAGAVFRTSQIWEAFLLVKVEEMEERYGVKVPWKRSLRAKAETKMGAQRLLACVDGGIRTVDELARDLKESTEFVRRCLQYLEEIGEVTIDRKSRPYRVTPSV